MQFFLVILYCLKFAVLMNLFKAMRVILLITDFTVLSLSKLRICDELKKAKSAKQ